MPEPSEVQQDEEDDDEEMDEEYTPEMANELMRRGLLLGGKLKVLGSLMLHTTNQLLSRLDCKHVMLTQWQLV